MTEFQIRLDRVRGFMAEAGVGAMLITRQANFAWLTGGGRGYVGLATEGSAAQILVLPTRAVLLVNNIEAGRLEMEELAGAPGLEAIVFPWYDEARGQAHLDELTRGQLVGADFPIGNIPQMPGFERLRWTLLPGEQAQARRLGGDLATALEGVCREFAAGETELQVAGRLSAAFWARGIEAVGLLVGGDARGCQHRHPLPSSNPINQYAVVAVTVRRYGLYLSATRLVLFGTPPTELAERHGVAASVDAAYINATRPGAAIGDIFAAGQAAYAAGGFPGEWQYHHQGGLAGFAGREYRALPGSTNRVATGQLFAWNPTVQGAKSEDTILVGPAANEVLTRTGNWPEGPFGRPGLLIRR